MEIYERQELLPITVPEKVAVVGVGGIGSWVALDMALAGAKTLILIDGDKIEETNLNRTPFKIAQIGMNKTEALKDLIYERRLDTEIITVNKRIEAMNRNEIGKLKNAYIIDARDNLTPLDVGFKPNIYLRYDGLSVTVMDELPDSAFTSGGGGYQTVPSFIAPPQLLAALVTTIVFRELEWKGTLTFNLDNLVWWYK